MIHLKLHYNLFSTQLLLVSILLTNEAPMCQHDLRMAPILNNLNHECLDTVKLFILCKQVLAVFLNQSTHRVT